MKILIIYLLSQCLMQTYGQLTSFCPEIFKYDNTKMENDRWYGELNLESEFPLSGIWVRIILDNKAELFGSTYEVLTKDNQDFLIKNSSFYLVPGQSVKMQIFVKFSVLQPIPKVKSIRLNGRTICPPTPVLRISQCPSVFLYDNTRFENNRWHGTLSLESEFELTGLWIRVTLDAPAEQLQTEYWEVVKRSDTEYLIRDPECILPTDTVFKVKLQVKYKPFTSVPNIKTIRLNGRTICGTVISEGLSSNDVVSKPVVTHTSIIAPVPSISQYSYPPSGQITCGTVETEDRIIEGRQASSYQWPWHGAIYRRNITSDTFICGMSLISERFTLTAAHCVTENVYTKKLSDKNTLILYFGLTSLKELKERFVQSPKIQQITIYPEYSISGNDIALIKFEKPVTFNEYVRPVCLWEGESDLNRIMDRQGTVVGFGVTENNTFSNELLYAKISVVNEDMCLFSYPEFYTKYTSFTTFCAGNIGSSAPCNGDSGGGLVFNRDGTNVWQIRGIVSRGVRRIHSFLCDNAHYVVFTDVAKFTPWIQEIMFA